MWHGTTDRAAPALYLTPYLPVSSLSLSGTDQIGVLDGYSLAGGRTPLSAVAEPAGGGWTVPGGMPPGGGQAAAAIVSLGG